MLVVVQPEGMVLRVAEHFCPTRIFGLPLVSGVVPPRLIVIPGFVPPSGLLLDPLAPSPPFQSAVASCLIITAGGVGPEAAGQVKVAVTSPAQEAVAGAEPVNVWEYPP